MKRKLLSIVLAVVMIVAMIPFGAMTVFADHIHSFTSGVCRDNGDGTHSQKCTQCDEYGVSDQTEVLPYTNIDYVDKYSFIGTNFKVSSKSADKYGMYGGTDFYSLKIEALDPSIIITGVDAVVGFYGKYYGFIGISSGEKLEKDKVTNGSTIHITDIYANTFSFTGGSNYVQFKDITIHYMTKSAPHSFTSGIYKDYGNGAHSQKCTQCDACDIPDYAKDMHSFTSGIFKNNEDGTHSQKCSGCDAYGMSDQTEVLPYTNIDYVDKYSFIGTNFKVSSKSADKYGMYGGTDFYFLKIEPLDPSIIITGVDAVVGFYGKYYGFIGISSGEKLEKDKVTNGSTIHVTDIYANTFSFTGGSDYVQFKDITVYYMTKSAPHTFADGVCVCGANEPIPAEATDGMAYAQKDSDTATMRFIWKTKLGDSVDVESIGAYVIPLDLFEVGETPTTVTYTNPTTADGEPIKSGNTFAVDVTNIPKTNYDRIFYAVPFINGNFFIEQLIEATVNEADINKKGENK